MLMKSLCCVLGLINPTQTKGTNYWLLSDRTPLPVLPPRWRTGGGPPHLGSCSSWTGPTGAGTPGCGPSSPGSRRSGRRSPRGRPAPGTWRSRWWRCTPGPGPAAGSPPEGRTPPSWWRSHRRRSPARWGTSGTPRLGSRWPRTPHPMCSPVETDRKHVMSERRRILQGGISPCGFKHYEPIGNKCSTYVIVFDQRHHSSGLQREREEEKCVTSRTTPSFRSELTRSS